MYVCLVTTLVSVYVRLAFILVPVVFTSLISSVFLPSTLISASAAASPAPNDHADLPGRARLPVVIPIPSAGHGWHRAGVQRCRRPISVSERAPGQKEARSGIDPVSGPESEQYPYVMERRRSMAAVRAN